MSRNLVIFMRSPRLGRVKNRLARDLGTIEALRLHRLMVMHVLEQVTKTRQWKCWICTTAEPAKWPRGIPRRRQKTGNLGERMMEAMITLPTGPVVLIGTDTPELKINHVRHAFALLKCKDVVFGPAEDGGYWLVGARRCAQIPHLFDGVRWSSKYALADTIANLSVGKHFGLLETLADVDNIKDLRRWESRRSRPLMRAFS